MRHAFWIGLAVWLAAGSAVADAPDAADRAAEVRLETAIVDAARERFGIELQTESPLRDAARELCVVRRAGSEVDPHEFLRQALSQYGVLDPFPYVFYGTTANTRVEPLSEKLLAGIRDLSPRERGLYTHVAAAVATRVERRRLWFVERTSYVTVLLTQRAISFAPLPFAAAPGERVLFEGELHPPFREPEVMLTRPDGGVSPLDNLSLEAGRFRTWVHLDAGPGEYQIEVLGRDDMGPRVLGLCSLFARREGQTTPHERLVRAARLGTLAVAAANHPLGREERTPDAAEARLLELLNRDRRHAGLGPLVADATLAVMARAHSEDMAEHDFFAHVSPESGHLAERAARLQLQYRRLAENIAVHRDVEEAEAALLRSPGHRINILDPLFTHVGVGVAFTTDRDGNRRVYVTQNFMIPAP